MPIINPDFLAYDAILEQFYGRSIKDAPKQSFLTSDAVLLGTLSKRDALIMDMRSNLGFAAKYILEVNLLPAQLVILDELWKRRFPALVMTRGGGKTFILAVYCCLRAVLTQGSKIVLVGASFRQSKLIFEEIQRIYNNSSIFQQACQRAPATYPDRAMLYVGNSSIIAIPMSHDGNTIRGLRATHIICDEFAAIPEEVFQVVVRGFAAVSKDPAKNVMSILKEKYLEKKGASLDSDLSIGNQIVISGTAYYKFNHFFKTIERYKQIVENKIQKTVKNDLGIIEQLDYKDYGIIKIPYTAIPPGFMDISQIAQAKATMHPTLFGMEYMAEFAGTTAGFFPMLDIENATAANVIKDESGNVVINNGEPTKNPYYSIEIQGDSNGIYVMGADPARDNDNFAVCIIRIIEGSYRVVFADAWNRKEWGYSVRRIRELIKKFNIQRLVIDKGGGGTTIRDLLKDTKYIEPGELPIFDIEEEDKKEEGKWHVGQQILEIRDFSDYQWYRESNYSLQGDIYHRRLLFPASYIDEEVYNKFAFKEQEIEDCFKNIQATRIELAQIERTVVGSNREHFDLPTEQIKKAKEKGMSERKDRYSALLLASYAARSFHGLGEWTKKNNIICGNWLELL